MRLPPKMMTVVAALALVACGGEDKEQQVSEVDVVDTSFGEVNFEVDVRPEINLPPDFGDPCDGNEDCTTGYCIEGPSGFVCTKTCDEVCPEGWGCKGVQSGSADVVFVCIQDGTGEPDVIIADTDTSSETVNDTTPVDTNIPSDTAIDTDTGPVSGNACEAPPGSPENAKGEDRVPAGDWPDCIVGCGFETNPTLWVVDLRSESFSAASGSFDADDHVYGFEDGEGDGPDIDVVAVKAAARTMMEFAVLKSAAASFTDPLLYVSDGFQVRTFNSDVTGNSTCGRTTIAFPYVSDLPLYVVAEEATNYDLWGPTGYDPGIVGGADYGWTLRIRTSPFAPTELGNVARGSSKNVSDERLTVGGEMRYYRFYAPGTATPSVTITRRSGGTFLPSLAGMKTIQNELVWQRVAEDENEDGIVQLGAGAFRPCIPLSECATGVSCPPNMCSDAQAEFIFAVFDFNGAAGPGAFSYDIAVRVD